MDMQTTNAEKIAEEQALRIIELLKVYLFLNTCLQVLPALITQKVVVFKIVALIFMRNWPLTKSLLYYHQWYWQTILILVTLEYILILFSSPAATFHLQALLYWE